MRTAWRHANCSAHVVTVRTALWWSDGGRADRGGIGSAVWYLSGRRDRESKLPRGGPFGHLGDEAGSGAIDVGAPGPGRSSRNEKEEMNSKREFSRSWGKLFLLFIALSIVLIAPVIGFLNAMDGRMVLGKGQYLAASQGPVYKVGFVDAFTLFVEPERQLDEGLGKACILAAIAFVSLAFGVALAWMKRRAAHDPDRLFIAVSLIFGFLAASQVLSIHAILGRNLKFLSELFRLSSHVTFIDRPVDGIIVLSSIAAGIVLTRYRKTLFASRGALALFGMAVACFLAGALTDVSALPGLHIERVSGLLSPAFGIAALLALAISQLRSVIADMRPAAPAAPMFTMFRCDGNDPG